MKPGVYRRFPAGNSVIAGSKTDTKRLHHIDETEVTVWALIAILLLATIAAGYVLAQGRVLIITGLVEAQELQTRW